MAYSMNKVILLGNLGRDAETTYTPNGKSVTKFSVATERSWKAEGASDYTKETTWTNIILWGQEKLAAQLLKGAKVMVEGRISTRSYDNKEGKKVWVTEVISENIILCNGSGSAAAGGGYSDNGGDYGDAPF